LHEFSVVAESQSFLKHLIPDETRAGIGHGIIAVVRITPAKSAEALLEVIGDIRLRTPLMAVRAEHTAAVEVVQQYKLLGESMVVGGDITAEMHEGRIPVSLRQISEDLVVGAVLLDDVEHVLEK